MSKVVILRPEPGAGETLARATTMGIEAMTIPLFELAALPWTAPNAASFDALLLTSANAARYGGEELGRLSDLPVHCVGPATAAAAEAAGLNVATTGTRDSTELMALVPVASRLLHLTGRNHRRIPGVAQIAVYHSMAIDPPPSLDALHGGVAMVHSPRAGARLAELVNARATIAIAAISAAAAEACGGGWRTVATIDAPDDGALLALAASLWQNR